MKVSLDDFCGSEYKRLTAFREWYISMNKLNPVEFPLHIDEDNSGMWVEAFMEYDIEDEVYKL
jgi:hypothetical protein